MKPCKYCGNILPYKRSISFCNTQCNADYRVQEIVKNWQIDANKATVKGGGLNRTIRKHLIKEANGACQECGRSDVHPVTGNHVLEIDHIDGDRSNNHHSNLKVLCLNCHSLTPTYRNNKRSKNA